MVHGVFPRLLVAFAICGPLLPWQSVQASTITIFVQGINLGYDSATQTLRDADLLEDPDPLLAVAFDVDGNPVGTPLNSSAHDLGIDLEIPGVTAIPAGGGSVTSSAGGNLALLIDGSSAVDLELEPANITLVESNGLFQVVFVGAVAAVDSQSLPHGLQLGETVSISLSTQLSDLELDGAQQFVQSFRGSGSGELSAVSMPEPPAVGLVLLAGLLLAIILFRLHLG